MKISPFLLILSLGCQLLGNAQQVFTHQDTLRGSITPERAWWDLTYYHLNIKVNPVDSTINGNVEVAYRVLQPNDRLQIDLQSTLKIKAVKDEAGNTLDFESDGNAHFIQLKKPQIKGVVNKINVFYGGRPKVAIRPPWDGGISWDTDANGNPIIHSNCQGIGASIWWPNKDHMYDEPDSVLISVNAPKNLMAVSNGRLRKVDKLKDGTKTYHWFVDNPISNYGVNINISNYKEFSEIYKGEKGDLTMDYFVLPYNLEKAKKQFKDAPRMMKAFEHWFGPYPFYEDGYKLVEVPSTGMEHQSSVTYGNGFKNGYRGKGSYWGMKFDFIIIHESAHEWFANNITYKDMADMWVHESFANYAESLFVEYYYGKEAGQEYVRANRPGIKNDWPIIGSYNVNAKGSGDMYTKGGNMLNTLREWIGDDEKWRSILRGLNKTFYHQTVTTEQIENYMASESGLNLKPFFNQYLRDIRIPVLEYYFKDGLLYYHWSNCVEGFNMPVRVTLDNNATEIQLELKADQWSNIETKATVLKINLNSYVASFEVQ
jgi:aminopeptidase N